MKSIHKTYHFAAPAKEVWAALVTPRLIADWGAGPAKMSDQAGEKFSLWDGEITGKNLEVEDEKYLKQEWHSSDMEEGVVSIVEFKLTQEQGNNTSLVLIHEGVPDKNHKSIAEGWDEYYMGPLQELVEK